METCPSKYNDQTLHTAKDYVLNFEKMGDVVPTVEGLADELHVGTKTIYNWAKEHVDFQEVLDTLKSKQGRLLQNKGLGKVTDASITKLMLAANHGMADKGEIDHTSKGEKITGVVVDFNVPTKSNETSHTYTTVIPKDL